jgi:hypothetical protein
MAINVTIDLGYEFEVKTRAAGVFAVVSDQSGGTVAWIPVEDEA